MTERRPTSEEEGGTLFIAALMLLALAFAGAWILGYVSGSGAPWGLLRWFVGAAVVVVVVGFLIGRYR